MRLHFLRHGKAESHRPGGLDSDRRLTEEGAKRIRSEAVTLSRLGFHPDVIISSPLVRARQTAEIVARELGLESALLYDDRLAYGCGLGDIQDIVAEQSHAEEILLVGHNPHFSTLPGVLVGGASIELKPGGLVSVELDRVEPGRGTLRWLLPPSLLALETDGGA